MRSIEDVQSISKIKLMLPGNASGIARFRLKSSKHTQLVRVVFSWHSGYDVLCVMFKQNKRPTPEEIAEVKDRFFPPEETPQCEEIPHPDNDLITVIYRKQEEYHEI
jgi:hypothetical protein